MTVHLLRASDLNSETLLEVLEILRSVPGPMRFLFDEHAVADIPLQDLSMGLQTKDDFFSLETSNFLKKTPKPSDEIKFPRTINTISQKSLFQACQTYRERNHNRIMDTDFVILLTETANSDNWFSNFDENRPRNGFVHTADWEQFVQSRDAFPVAYEVVATILQSSIFKNYRDMLTHVHRSPKGCLNDLCENKRDVFLKLRTADICYDCMKRLKKGIPSDQLKQSLALFETLRKRMLFSQNFKQETPLSNLVIDEAWKIWLPGFENLYLDLTPLERTIYLFLLLHPTGVDFKSMGLYKDELYKIYGRMATIDNKELMVESIQMIVDNANNSLSQKISKINRKIKSYLGDELSIPYSIVGDKNKPRKITLPRSYVKWEHP